MGPIERAARALHLFNMKGSQPRPENYPWEDLSPREQALLRARARVVIAAIREPSEEMHDAGDAVCDNNAIGAWYAMIDKLLEEGQ